MVMSWKPRSNLAEQSSDNYKGDKYSRKRNVLRVVYTLIIRNKKIVTLPFLVFVVMHTAHSLIKTHRSKKQSTCLAPVSPAYEESLSFFDDIEPENWSLMKDKFTNMKRSRVDYIASSRDIEFVYQHRYQPDFLCTHERRIGKKGDGGKWVCDPHRITAQKSCLVYSVGSNGDWSFERAVKRNIGRHCEIHTFDFGDFGEGSVKAGANYHRWGISNVNEGDYKTLEKTVEELGHVGRTIDIFKIDCEGCEWDTFQSWLGIDVNLRQILVEVHHEPHSYGDEKTLRFYDQMESAGYVIFHREANVQYSFFENYLRCMEVAFLKLDKSFF